MNLTQLRAVGQANTRGQCNMNTLTSALTVEQLNTDCDLSFHQH